MEITVVVLAILSVIWVFVDARARDWSRTRYRSWGPSWWGVMTFLLWIVFFPWYLAVRRSAPLRCDADTRRMRPPVRRRDPDRGLIISGIVLALLLPIVGFIFGAVLLLKSRVGPGLGVIALCPIGVLVAVALMFGLPSLREDSTATSLATPAEPSLPAPPEQAPAIASARLADMTATDMFDTPSRGITCEALVAETDASTAVRCRVLSAMSQSGEVPVAEVKDTGGARIRSVMAPDAVASGERVVAYGEAVMVAPGLPAADGAGLSCSSDESGLTCENDDGHGFTIARETQDTF